MASVIGGQTKWGGSRDKEGHRKYTISHRVRAALNEGPNGVLNAIGLPVTGSTWNFGIDVDTWAFCSPEKKVSLWQHNEGEIHSLWDVESIFSTVPIIRCQDTDITDPLLEPDRISGSFVNYTKEITQDFDGNPVKSSSHEIYRGPQVEFDHNRATVKIDQNVSSLGLDLFTPMVNTVNDSNLWGLGPRKIKLSNASWTRKYQGICDAYYERNFEFDIDFEDFDRIILDEGTKALNGKYDTATGLWTLINVGGGAPDPTNPSHFCRYKDRKDENGRTLLDGSGKPLTAGASPFEITVKFYQESNFLSLGITPTL